MHDTVDRTDDQHKPDGKNRHPALIGRQLRGKNSCNELLNSRRILVFGDKAPGGHASLKDGASSSLGSEGLPPIWIHLIDLLLLQGLHIALPADEFTTVVVVVVRLLGDVEA